MDCLALGIRSDVSVYHRIRRNRLKVRYLFVLNEVCERPGLTRDLISYINYLTPSMVIIIGFGGVFVFCKIV